MKPSTGRWCTHKRVPTHVNPANPALGLNPVDLKLVNFPIKYADLSLGLNLKDDTGIATTAPDSSAAIAEITFPSGLLKYQDDGNWDWKAVSFKIEYRPTGSIDWLPLPSASSAYYGGGYVVDLPKEGIIDGGVGGGGADDDEGRNDLRVRLQRTLTPTATPTRLWLRLTSPRQLITTSRSINAFCF